MLTTGDEVLKGRDPTFQGALWPISKAINNRQWGNCLRTMYTLEPFVEGTGRVEEEQEKLAIHVESKLILEKVDVSHRT